MFTRFARGCMQRIAPRVTRPVAPQFVLQPQQQQVRHLNVHEYVGMEIFQRYGINVPKGSVVTSVSEAKPA